MQRISRQYGIQPKLTIGEPNDIYEQEADRVADKIVKLPDPRMQRQPNEEEEEEKVQAKKDTPLLQLQEDDEEEPIQMKSYNPSHTSLIQRQEDNEEDETIQTKRNNDTSSVVPTHFDSFLQSLKGNGHPLDSEVRSYFEPRFGVDFSDVRVHTDRDASETARSINAQAYTTGNDIIFGAGFYKPESISGKKLIAHELTHVIQQKGNKKVTLKNKLQRQVNFNADFSNITLIKGANATINNGMYTFYNGGFLADANITATAPTAAELNEWDVGVLQDSIAHWDRYYWLRENTDGRGRFVEQKYLPINARFRDQVIGTTTVWGDDTDHQLLRELTPTSVGGATRVSTTIYTADFPMGRETVNGSAIRGMDTSDGIRNINMQDTGGRFNTWISAHNIATNTWRHLRQLNWNYERSHNFRGSGATLATNSEQWQLGHHGPHSADNDSPVLTGRIFNTVLDDPSSYSRNRVDIWS